MLTVEVHVCTYFQAALCLGTTNTDCTVCVCVSIKGKYCTVMYMRCVCSVVVIITPDDVTKCQNWLKMRGGVVSGCATPR